MDGKKLVVFETLELNGKIICKHKDLEDAGQTVSVTSAPITGDESNIGLYVSLMLIAAGLAVVCFVFLFVKKEKKEKSMDI